MPGQRHPDAQSQFPGGDRRGLPERGAVLPQLDVVAGPADLHRALVAGDRMFFAIAKEGKESICAVNLATSKAQWTVPIPVVPLSLTESDGQLFAIDRSTNELCAWDAQTGHLLWKDNGTSGSATSSLGVDHVDF